jgi:hypothetical protein
MHTGGMKWITAPSALSTVKAQPMIASESSFSLFVSVCIRVYLLASV